MTLYNWLSCNQAYRLAQNKKEKMPYFILYNLKPLLSIQRRMEKGQIFRGEKKNDIV